MSNYKLNDIVKYDGYVGQILGIFDREHHDGKVLSIKIYNYEKFVDLDYVPSDSKLLTEATEYEKKYFGKDKDTIIFAELAEIKAMLTKLTNPKKL